jgi:hypothetical protein
VSFEPKCKATAIGSVPHTDVDTACRLSFDNLPNIPIWPQLPNINFKEGMFAQCSEGMPGMVINEIEHRLYFDTARDIVGELDRLFTLYANDDVETLAFGPDYAHGFYRFLEMLGEDSSIDAYPEIEILKGHIVGPVTLGLTVTDENRKPALYNEILREGILKTLIMKARFQVKRFKEIRPAAETIIFIDDPSIMSIGSALVSLNREEVIGYFNEMVEAIDGYVGVHCCGNTDWSLLAESNIDIINFDAYSYSETVALYPEAIGSFLDHGGVLAWGIVPSGLPSPEVVVNETLESLLEKLEAGMQMLVDKGIDKEVLIRQGLITPNCGTGSMKPSNAERTFSLTRQVSEAMHRRYFDKQHRN